MESTYGTLDPLVEHHMAVAPGVFTVAQLSVVCNLCGGDDR